MYELGYTRSTGSYWRTGPAGDVLDTVPLLDGMEVLQLNIWREMMRREDWEEIPLPAGDA